jgi:hypothetical protein
MVVMKLYIVYCKLENKGARRKIRLPLSELFCFDQVGQHLVDVIQAVIVAVDLI